MSSQEFERKFEVSIPAVASAAEKERLIRVAPTVRSTICSTTSIRSSNAALLSGR
jgi:hypothetical protein